MESNLVILWETYFQKLNVWFKHSSNYCSWLDHGPQFWRFSLFYLNRTVQKQWFMLYSRIIKYFWILALLYFWIGPLQGWQLPTTVFRLCHFLLFPLYPHSSYIQGKDLVILCHERSKIKIWNKDLFRVSSEHLFNNLLSNKPKLILHQKDFFFIKD